MPQPFHLCHDLGELHAYERLNYVLGQVLGVKDFQQEQAYFLHKARLHNRSLHGYGTVWGLDVTMAGTGAELEIQVSPGFAIDTQGREVLVDALQCARLNTWLNAVISEGSTTVNRDTLKPIAGEGSPLAVYVTLCYHPCPTGAQPILGNPCRTDSGEEGVIQYTRIRDDFELKLLPQPPIQYEEAHVRAMGELLAKIETSEITLDSDALKKLQESLQNYLDNPSSVQSISTRIQLPESKARNILRELFRYWVTHTRPRVDEINDPISKLLKKITASSSETTTPLEGQPLTDKIKTYTDLLHNYLLTYDIKPIEEELETESFHRDTKTQLEQAIHAYWNSLTSDCILLAAVQFKLAETNTVDETTLQVVNLQRPYLLHTRLLQELLLQGLLRGSGGTGPPGSPGTDATIEIAPTRTGEPGTDANVQNLNAPDNTNVRLEFTIPRGAPGTTPQITVGNVTRGDPGTPPAVTPRGDATNVILDFTIPQGETGSRGETGPQGETGSGLEQLIIRPNDMVLSLPDARQDEKAIFSGLRPAQYGSINGYPALIFLSKTIAAFSTLRPTNIQAGDPLFLRLYCAVQEKREVKWTIHWRWVKALRPGEGVDPAAELSTKAFENGKLDMAFEDQLYLYSSTLFPLKQPDDRRDYLLVYLIPNLEKENEAPLYLLMVELRWGKVDE